jgi:hypothetical protein
MPVEERHFSRTGGKYTSSKRAIPWAASTRKETGIRPSWPGFLQPLFPGIAVIVRCARRTRILIVTGHYISLQIKPPLRAAIDFRETDVLQKVRGGLCRSQV